MRTAAAYAVQLGQLLPRGRAWPRDPDSVLGRLLAAFAPPLARVDARANDLLDEADPGTALETLPDWERVTGLPDACVPAPDSLRERQIAVASRYTRLGGQSRATFIATAASLGYLVTIAEFRPFGAGSHAGDDANGDAWAHAWRVDVLPSAAADARALLSVFTAGSTAGERLVGFGALDLECLIGRAAPAHTTVFFAYPPEPRPVLWADFTR